MSAAAGSYQLQLNATPKNGSVLASWGYPETPAYALSSERNRRGYAQPRYEIVGDGRPGWKPLRVFDDGKSVFIKFKAEALTHTMPQLYVM